MPSSGLFSKLSCYKPLAGWQWGWSITQSHSPGLCPHLHPSLTVYPGARPSHPLGLCYLLTPKSWATCQSSNYILRCDPRANTHTHTHTHTNTRHSFYLATEWALQLYEFPTHTHLLGLLIALDQVKSKYLFLTSKALPSPNCLSSSSLTHLNFSAHCAPHCPHTFLPLPHLRVLVYAIPELPPFPHCYQDPTFLFFFFFNLFYFIYLFIFGCVGSSFLCEGFL